MSPPAGEPVELIEFERIVPHGSARTTWLVRRADGWVRAAAFPGATVEQLDAGPGTVWERRVRLVLATGTEILKVEARPRDPERKDPMAYLRGAPGKIAEARRQSTFRVLRGGRLEIVGSTPRRP